MSNQQGGTADCAKVALTYIDSLTARFENAERHINEDIEQIERRLEQLMELMTTVSSIQQQVTSNQETLASLRLAVKDNLEQLTEMIGGVDSKYAKQLAAVSKKALDAVGVQVGDTKKIGKTVSDLEDKLQTWLNRGIGGWAMFTLVIGIFQYVGLQYINGLQQERDAAHVTISKMSTRISDLESRQQALERHHLQRGEINGTPQR